MYLPQERKFLFHDKYFGQTLDAKGFFDVFRDFFNNKQLLRRDVIPKFLEKLNKLTKIVKSKANYRFFSSSLLLVYEGLAQNFFHIFGCWKM